MIGAARNAEVQGEVCASGFNLGYTLGSGQVFRWGRDADGWWKGIAYNTVFHLRQDGDSLHYLASSTRVPTYLGPMPVSAFLEWYLRLKASPRIRVSRDDTRLRAARQKLRGFRFVRQEPFECIISYVLSVQAHMNLTKQRINFIAKSFGDPISFRNEAYWTFPQPHTLASQGGTFFRRQRFGWRSERVPLSAQHVSVILKKIECPTLDQWRSIVDELKGIPGTGVGLKVGKCIDLFSMDRLNAVPVDTWVLKLAKEWYGVKGSDAKVCAWAENRGGSQAGYMNEYLFIYYRELNAPTLHDQVISFCASDIPSPELPFERVGAQDQNQI